MTFDIFLSICQTEVDGYTPNEKKMFANFFDQVRLADELGFGTAWVAETHLSCQIQKENPGSVIPHFKGEIGLNTDILQLAHVVMAQTKKINVGSAIMNIICNGGPIAHAEAIKTFLSLQQQTPAAGRTLEIGFAAGRFPFSNSAYGFVPKTALETSSWDVIKNKYFQEAAEIFVRLLKGEHLSSSQISDRYLSRQDFRSDEEWTNALNSARPEQIQDARIQLDHHWNFPKVGVIPFEAPLGQLKLTIGSHDPEAQIQVNKHLPVGVFNLSITPGDKIEETHQRMKSHYHPAGGAWQRQLMPRTLLLFLDTDRSKAKAQATKAWENYWKAMEKTLDPKKVASAVENTIAGNPEDVIAMIKAKYHPEDRLMLWFDFNNHENQSVKQAMRLFMEKVQPHLSSSDRF